ncbi:MAG: phospholipase D-like domain-containing protein [Nanoarchaeota archaeon]|nr:hypothetical protein [Nanoarchaeota archaeon]MBU1631747.1 hypothetical protein [Nanoarchaeota archaeon]
MTSFYFSDFDLNTLTGLITLEPKEQTINTYVQDNGDIQTYFCPRDDCETALTSFIDSAEQSIDCALFDIGLESVQNKLLEKEKTIPVRIVTDNDYLKKFNHSFVKADKWGLMHNKFCIIDKNKISTGSMNPTNNGAHKNNNNLLLISSKVLASNYQDEFDEMWNGTFKKGNKILNPSISINNIDIKNYFCPEDKCADRVKEELKKAERSIYFMTFSFTHEGIANILLMKNLDNLTINGVMETRQISEYSQFERLNNNGIEVFKDGNKNNMHHKVFIIDEKTVITGSFNPTGGGDSNNDENILIIEDEEIAGLFINEFNYVQEEAVKTE